MRRKSPNAKHHKGHVIFRLTGMLAALLLFGLSSINLQADTYEASFTGEDFYSLGYFPIADRQPVLLDTSLFFGPAGDWSAGPRWEKLAALPVFPEGTFSPNATVTISMLINLTWVENDASDNDWDPHIMLADGTNMSGITILDQGGVDLASCADEDVLFDDVNPQRVKYGGLLGTDPLPYVNMSFDVQIVWTISPAGTSVYVSHLGLSAQEPAIIDLNPAGPLSLVFLSDNQLHEKYQINFVSVVAEGGLTCNCDTPGLFDPPMDDNVTVKKGNRVIPLQFDLCDEFGTELTDQDISAPMVEVDYAGEADDVEFMEDDFLTAGHGDDGNIFIYSGSKWVLNLQTKMFSQPGVYTITVVSTDPENYEIFPTCSVDFIITQ